MEEKKNGNGNGQLSKETKRGARKAKKETSGQQTSTVSKAVTKKLTEKKKDVFEPKPIPDAVKPIAESIEKMTDLENLKAVARVLKRHWKKIYLDACKKAIEGLKAGNVVWFRKGSKLIEGKVVKVKTNGKVKIDGEDGKKWKVPGLLVHEGKPTGTDRAEAIGSKVTKKAA